MFVHSMCACEYQNKPTINSPNSNDPTDRYDRVYNTNMYMNCIWILVKRLIGCTANLMFTKYVTDVL